LDLLRTGGTISVEMHWCLVKREFWRTCGYRQSAVFNSNRSEKFGKRLARDEIFLVSNLAVRLLTCIFWIIHPCGKSQQLALTDQMDIIRFLMHHPEITVHHGIALEGRRDKATRQAKMKIGR
jgi:hypothetical protein